MNDTTCPTCSPLINYLRDQLDRANTENAQLHDIARTLEDTLHVIGDTAKAVAPA